MGRTRQKYVKDLLVHVNLVQSTLNILKSKFISSF